MESILQIKDAGIAPKRKWTDEGVDSEVQLCQEALNKRDLEGGEGGSSSDNLVVVGAPLDVN